MKKLVILMLITMNLSVHSTRVFFEEDGRWHTTSAIYISHAREQLPGVFYTTKVFDYRADKRNLSLVPTRFKCERIEDDFNHLHTNWKERLRMYRASGSMHKTVFVIDRLWIPRENISYDSPVIVEMNCRL